MKVGIDLGTTNSALAWTEAWTDAEAAEPSIQILDIEQHVAEDRKEKRRTLPSFLYAGEQGEFTGAFAREQGALAPTRSVYAAKSWLSHSEVDRQAKILPWDAQEAGRLYSPVEASAKYLAHLARAWREQQGTHLGEQDIVLTVPASFDQEARELTVEAAKQAGLENITLIEEPAAAFYSWISSHLAQSRKTLADGQTILVCDVGGGTSDFTLIRVQREGDLVQFTRTAVGKHLLLGGDNLDLTLAWLVESKLNTQLSLRQRSALRRQCAAAKEKLLGENPPASVEITVLGGGSSLIGGVRRTEITREEALELALDGFLPQCEFSERPSEDKKSVFRELGLPYVSDPAITRHLAAFLAEANSPAPDAILFNGGFFIPEILRERVAAVLESWFQRRPIILENRDLDLAVAVGAAYYANVRGTGNGVLVRGGLPRAYYLAIGGHEEEELNTVCLVPRGTEEGSTLELDIEGLQLVANKPVSFRLYSSLHRVEDSAGAQVRFSAEEAAQLYQHAPLAAVIRFGAPGQERMVPVKLRAHLSEVGTLRISAASRISEHEWRLQFELRRRAAGQSSAGVVRAAAQVSEEALAAAEELIRSTFTAGNRAAPEELPSRLEQTLSLGRLSWPLPALRRLADAFLDAAEGRRLSAAHELRWLNLAGFCLRPGFGFPGDDLRMEKVRRVYAAGLAFASQTQNEIDWWIFQGRVAGGLNRAQQNDLWQRLSTAIVPKGARPKRANESLLREMWRCAASLELLPLGVKTDLGDRLSKRELSASECWCLGRLGARKLLYGPNNLCVAPTTAARWIDALSRRPHAAEALAQVARRTGDAARDVAPAAWALAERVVREHKESAALLPILEGAADADAASQGRLFGEELPSGLVFQAQE
jgi:molecular chaperone DnaK (HSP70)